MKEKRGGNRSEEENRRRGRSRSGRRSHERQVDSDDCVRVSRRSASKGERIETPSNIADCLPQRGEG